MKAKIILNIVIITALIFSSCDTINLGQRLHLEPPEVEILSPDFMENINTNILKIEGEARDLEEVKTLFVSVELVGDPFKIELKSEQGVLYRLNDKNQWTEVDYQNEWITDNNSFVEWSIDIPIDKERQGEYIINAGAVNNVNTEGPYKQRRFIIDLSPPSVEVSLPVLQYKDTAVETFTFNDDVKPAFDNYRLRTPADLEWLHNRSVKIQYEINDDFSVDEVTFILADQTGDHYYFEKTLEKSLWSGSFIIDAKEIIDELGNEADYKKYFQIISFAKDKANNSKIETHGWFVWWPEADLPWSEGVGDTTEEDEVENMTQVFPGMQVRGQSYDNQGVKCVKYALYAWNGSDYNMIEEDEITNLPLIEGGDPSRFFSWSFDAPNDSNKYRIVVITTDINGLESNPADVFYFYVYPILTGPLLQGFGGSSPGTYVLDDEIEIILNLREPVKFTDNSPTMTLNFTSPPERTAVFDASSNGSRRLKFTYKIQAGDSVDVLTIKQINLNTANYVKAIDNTPFQPGDELRLDGKDGNDNGLDFYTKITVVTDVPQLINTNYSNEKLTIAFSKIIFKGTGSITLTQQGTYLAPAVLSKADYLMLGGDAILGNYYNAGINGAIQTEGSWNADTEEKYILKYELNTDNDGLITALKGQNADKIIIPVVSAAVTYGSGNTSLIIDLGDTYGYVPRVKGVSYIITFNEGLVRDSQNNKVASLTADTLEILDIPGVNKPFVRVQRRSETLSGNPVTAALPTTAGVKFDCQTPDAVIRYSYNERVTTPYTSDYTTNGAGHVVTPPVMPDTSTSSGALTLPAATEAQNQTSYNGYLYFIIVQAAYNGETEINHEIAARSVIRFDNTNVKNWDTLTTLAGTRALRIWIRGGDQLDGNNNTAGFPLQWDDKTLNNGARLLRNTSGQLWHWMTWEVNVPAYFNFLAGTVDGRVNDITSYGPIDWSWGKNWWAFQHRHFPLYPGSSITFVRGTVTPTNATDDFEFFDTFSGNRTNRLPD